VDERDKRIAVRDLVTCTTIGMSKLTTDIHIQVSPLSLPLIVSVLHCVVAPNSASPDLTRQDLFVLDNSGVAHSPSPTQILKPENHVVSPIYRVYAGSLTDRPNKRW
jgi:hypothetical protein